MGQVLHPDVSEHYTYVNGAAGLTTVKSMRHKHPRQKEKCVLHFVKKETFKATSKWLMLVPAQVYAMDTLLKEESASCYLCREVNLAPEGAGSTKLASYL